MMPLPRLATPADAGEIARLRSELILSEPLDETWLARCSDLLAARARVTITFPPDTCWGRLPPGRSVARPTATRSGHRRYGPLAQTGIGR